MTKEKLASWIEKLAKANPKDRAAIVGDMCKENGLKVGDAWRLLKEAGFDPKAAPQGNGQQGGVTPDNTGAASGSDETAKPSGDKSPADETKQGTEEQGNGTLPNPPAKKRVRHDKLKGKNLIVGNKLIAFDADGIAELDAADAERLLTIPDYTEVRE